jgi:DNA-binding CsgD family transcriptional regulator
VKPTAEVSNLINCLTNNEDARQDLWVHYLSGTPVESLSARLTETQVEYSDDLELRKAVWALVQTPLSDEMSNFLHTNFTDYERSVICLLALGLDAGQISVIKGISEVRIRQSIATIRYNKVWNEYRQTVHKVQSTKK